MKIFTTIADLEQANLKEGQLVVTLENSSGNQNSIAYFRIYDSSTTGGYTLANGNKAIYQEISPVQTGGVQVTPVSLSLGQTVVTTPNAVQGSRFEVVGSGTDNGLLLETDDYTVTGDAEITLTRSYPDGTKLVQIIGTDVTGIDLPVVYQSIVQAKQAQLTAGTLVRVPSRGNAEYIVEPSSYVPIADGYGDHTMDDGKVLRLVHSGEVNTEWFGVKPDANFNATNNPTDNTVAAQSAIDYLNGEESAVAVFPSGFTMIRSLNVKAGVKIKGLGAGITYLIQKAGETTPILTDQGSVANCFIEDISLDCNHNAISTAGVYLGYNGQQLGVIAGIKNTFVRNVTGNGLKVNGNVAVLDWVEVYFCTQAGVTIDGEGNKARNIMISNCDINGVILNGSSNSLYNSHYETACSDSCVKIGEATTGNVVDGVKITGVSANPHGAGVKIEANASNFSLSNIRASVTDISKVTNGLVYDLSNGVRKIFGTDVGGVSFALPEYSSGVRVDIYRRESTPPTVGAYRTGDFFHGGIGLAGYPIGWVCRTAGDYAATPPTWTPMETNSGAINKSADEVLTRNDVGRRFTNESASGVITLTLPAVQDGDRIHFTRRNSTHALRIDPNGAQLIRPASSGKYVSLDTDGASVTLEYMSANSWVIVSDSGTISFEP